MFISIGEEMLNLEHDKGELFEQLSILFSKDNIKSIAKENKNSGCILVENIRGHLVKFFTVNDLYSVGRQCYIDLFISEFRSRLENRFPEEYEKVFLNDFRSENKQDHLEISAKVNKLTDKVNELKKYNLNIKTCYDLNEWYVNNTKKKCVNVH